MHLKNEMELIGRRVDGGQKDKVSLLFYILINEARMFLNPHPHEVALFHSSCVSAKEVSLG